MPHLGFRHLFILLLLHTALGGHAQAPKPAAPAPKLEKPFPTDGREFALEVNRRLEKGTPEQQRVNRAFILAWVERRFGTADLERLAGQSNELLKRGLKTWPDVAYLLSGVSVTLNPNAQINVPLPQYLSFIDTCLAQLPTPALERTVGMLHRFLSRGVMPRPGSAIYRLRFQRIDAQLGFGATGDYPVLNVNKSYFSVINGTDSVAIYDAAGQLDLQLGRFTGTFGKYDYEKLGLAQGEIVVSLYKFVVDVAKTGFKADSATLFWRGVSVKPEPGTFDEPLEHINDPKKALTPVFRSFDQRVELKAVQKGVDFRGGFELRGLQKFGYGTDEMPASITLSRKGAPVLRMQARSINLSQVPLRNDRNAVTIWLPDGDSLYHPSMNFRYYPEKTEVLLLKDQKDPYYRQPMTSSYHRYGFFFEQFRWNTESDSMVFSATVDQTNRMGAIESESYFLEQRFRQYRGLLPFNPMGICYEYIVQLRKRADAKRKKAEAAAAKAKEEAAAGAVDEFGFPIAGGSSVPTEPDPWAETASPDPFGATGSESGDAESDAPAAVEPTIPRDPIELWHDVNDVLAAFKLTKHKVGFMEALQNLDAAGYIYFKPKAETFRAKQKLIAWNRAARREIDYDVIQVISKTPKSDNADLNFATKQMRINGVESFVLSDSQMVEVRPQQQIVEVGQNRNLRFGGLVYAGKLNLYGQGTERFEFDYGNFKILTTKLDSVKFAPKRDRAFDPRKNPQLTKALERLNIQDVSGAIYINRPTNKSGIKPVKRYPVFDCYSYSYVYWNASNIQKGQYPKQRLNFALDPFVLDSLENFNIENLQLIGEFYAADIIPSFRDTLKPVRDNTYGVREPFPAPGVALYKDKGEFEGTMEMDGYGLHGQGQTRYLTTVAKADTFLFHFDSVMTVTKSFVMNEGQHNGQYYPPIAARNVRYTWYPRRDTLKIETTRLPLVLHKGSAFFYGQVFITPRGVVGRGVVEAGLNRLESDSIDLANLKISAGVSTYRVENVADTTKFDFVVERAAVAIDVKNRNATFETSDPGKQLGEFTVLKYRTSMSKGAYDHKNKRLTLTSKYPEKKNNTFTSLDTLQSGLTFAGGTATYDLPNQRLVVRGVDSLIVGDAVVYPDSQKLAVLKVGKLEKLSNARMVMDTVQRSHRVVKADLEIASRIAFRGRGFYPYRTQGVNEQLIELVELYSKADTSTYARGKVKTEDSFLISDRIAYRDTVILRSRNRFLSFAGQVKIQSTKPFFADAWFAFKDPNVNPDTVVVPIKSPRNPRTRNPLMVGISYLGSRKKFNSNFFQEKRDRREKDVLTAEGGLTYDRSTREFRVGPYNKLSGLAYRGNLVSYDDELGVTTSRGRILFPYSFPGTGAQVEMAGSWRDDAQTTSVMTRLVMKLTLPGLEGDPLDDLHSKFALYTQNNGDYSFGERIVIESLAEFIDPVPDSLGGSEEKTNQLAIDITNVVDVRKLNVAKDIGGTLVLGDVRLTYNDSIKGFYSASPVALVGIGGKPINKMLDSKIEYRLGRALPDGTALSDTLRLYLQVDDATYIYFELRGKELRTFGSMDSYNRRIEELIAKQEKKKEDPESPDLTLVLLKESDKTQFIRRFSRYLLSR